VPIDQLFGAAFGLVVIGAMNFDSIPNMPVIAYDVGVVSPNHCKSTSGFANRASSANRSCEKRFLPVVRGAEAVHAPKAVKEASWRPRRADPQGRRSRPQRNPNRARSSVKDMAENHNFPGLKAVARITSKRGRDKTVRRNFLLTQCNTPAELLRIVRQHWNIENALHWTPDVDLDEDQARSRKDHAPANLAVLRRLAVNPRASARSGPRCRSQACAATRTKRS
jgi:predicted transposase YbfD/YdcC